MNNYSAMKNIPRQGKLLRRGYADGPEIEFCCRRDGRGKGRRWRCGDARRYRTKTQRSGRASPAPTREIPVT